MVAEATVASPFGIEMLAGHCPRKRIRTVAVEWLMPLRQLGVVVLVGLGWAVGMKRGGGVVVRIGGRLGVCVVVMGMEMSWVRLAHGVGGCLFGHGDLGWMWREVGSRRGRGRFVWWLRGEWFD